MWFSVITVQLYIKYYYCIHTSLVYIQIRQVLVSPLSEARGMSM